jgi:4-amino-4-deoxy-L-arabinose transferase-like glycosyltransferase
MSPSAQSRVFALLASFIFLAVLFCVWRAGAMREGTGFEERAYDAESCTGPARVRTVREPFEREAVHAGAACTEWTAYLAAPHKMKWRVEVTSQSGAEVRVDDAPVVVDPGPHELRARTGTVDVAGGVHRVVAVSRHGEGAAYFRVAAVDELDPHDAYITPPLDLDQLFVRDEVAARALLAPPAAPSSLAPALAGGLALVAAGVLVWLAVRARRARPFPAADLAVGAALFALALFVRAHALDLQDTCWDEPTYVTAAQHYVHNVALGDFASEAWAKNYDHLPHTKWLLAFGWVLGGFGGARLMSAVASALATALLYAFGAVALGRRVGLVAGALAVVLPLWVAHGRVAGHDSFVLCFWTASMVALACWMRSTAGTRAGDGWAAFLCTFLATTGVFARPTTVWIFIVIAAVWLARSRRDLRRGFAAMPIAALAGVVAAVALGVAAWPFVWERPFEHLARIEEYRTRPLGDIEVYMGKLCLPAWHYFPLSFLAETPALLVALALAGVALALSSARARAGGRGFAFVTLLWLLAPFGQCMSHLRIGLGRYVITSWPALLLLAAVALDAAGTWLARRTRRPVTQLLPGTLAVLYAGIALVRVEPFPLDYFDEVVGGPRGVAASRLFEVPWWGEGGGAAVRWVNANAPQGARVRLMLWPPTEAERVRDDLVLVGEGEHADLVVVSHLQYFAKPPDGCADVAHQVTVAGQPIIEVFRCADAGSDVSAIVGRGFAAMGRPGGADVALAAFTEALQKHPGDAGATFGMAWALQAKGDLARAEPLYVAAENAATRAGNDEIAYYAAFNRGTLYEERGEHARAVEAFRAAVATAERDPQKLGAQLPAARHDLSLALAALGDAGAL